MARLVEVSHSIEAGMITYPGIPPPAISDLLSREALVSRYSAGTSFYIGRLDLPANTGTYVDAPFHRFAEGADVAAVPLERLADLEGTLCDASGSGRAIGADVFEEKALAGRAVLVRTGWDAHWGTPRYFEGNPFLTRGAAERLVSAGAALVGIDSLNIDDTADGARPAHTLLLRAGIPIVEHLCNLASVPASGFRFHAVPAPVKGMGSFPVRAYALLA